MRVTRDGVTQLAGIFRQIALHGNEVLLLGLPVEPMLIPVIDLQGDEKADDHKHDFAQGTCQVARRDASYPDAARLLVEKDTARGW